jgi:hypothetical protein
MAIGGIDGEGKTEVTATDPLSGKEVPVTVVSRAADEIVVEMEATDSPRLLTIDEEPPAPESSGTPESETPGAPGGGTTPETQEAQAAQPVLASPLAGDATSGAPRLRIAGATRRRLLESRRMTLVASCDLACAVHARGRLEVGRRRYAIRQVSQQVEQKEGGGLSVKIELAIGRGAALSARRARAAHTHVRAVVSVTAASGSGATTASRRLVFGP